MKPMKPPGYVKRIYHQPHRVAGGGLCPVCGRFARVDRTDTANGMKTQYRYCKCGESFKTVIRLDG